MNMDMHTSSSSSSSATMDMDVPHKSGYFSGHAFAATGFTTFGLFFLGLTLCRARSLPPGVSFAETHIPERNRSVLTTGGLVVCTMALLGCCTETGWDNIIAPATHISLYLTTALMGLTALLEGTGRLPPDSWRLSVVVGMCLQYVVWHEHALMKQLPADFRLHELLAQLCLVGAATVAYSIRHPQNVIAYVASQGTCILMGLWLYTGGIYAAFIDIPPGLIGVLLVSEALLVSLMIVVGAAFLLPRHRYNYLGSGKSKLSHYHSLVQEGEALSPKKSEQEEKPTITGIPV